MSCMLCSSTSSSRLFPEQSFRLAHGEPSSASSSRLWRWTSRVANESTAAASCCSSGVAKTSCITRTHCCHRMTVRTTGGRRTACATPSRCELLLQQQQQHSSSEASIGAVVGRARVFCEVVRDAVGFKKFFDGAIRSAHPVEKVDFLDGMCGLDCSIEKVGIEKALFRLRKNARFGLRSEIALFDPPVRLHKNWPN